MSKGHQKMEMPAADPETSPATVLNSQVADTQKTVLHVAGVDCQEEVAAIESALKATGHVRHVTVSITTGRAIIGHDQSLSKEDIIASLDKAGLKATEEGSPEAKGADQGQKGRVIAVTVCGALTAVGLLIQWTLPELNGWRIACFTAAIAAGGYLVAPKAFRALRQRRLDMNVLMTVAVAGATFIGEWEEAATVVFLFALSELLESFSVARARRAFEALMKLAPETALLKKGDDYVEAPVSEVKENDVVLVKSGARIPLDGEVTEGRSSVNQAPITGESMPVEKTVGDGVFAGTINEEGSLVVRVTKASGDTTLAKIIRLVQDAQDQKAPAQRFVDRFAAIYTPAVMVIALAIFLVPGLVTGEWGTWFYRALVMLVIACPCALVISTPVSIVSGLAAMARRGVLIKGGSFLESVGSIRAIAVDKTGTITEGKPKVAEVVPLDGEEADRILALAAAIDAHSDHPLAKAIVAHAKESSIEIPPSKDYRSQTGRGAEASIDGHLHFVGNHRFAHELHVCSPELEARLKEVESKGQTAIVIGHKPHHSCAGKVLGILAMGDTIRPESKDAVRALHESGLEAVIMLSGDNQTTVNAIAKEAGIDEARGDLLPEDKVEAIRSLLGKYQKVAMIGDGVNDAPAMAAATIGIAMGAAGTDTAIETADIALMTDDLRKVAETIKLGRRVLRIIQFNIAFAIIVKVVFLVLAVFGATSLWLAILADTGATMIVIANALRLLANKPTD